MEKSGDQMVTVFDLQPDGRSNLDSGGDNPVDLLKQLLTNGNTSLSSKLAAEQLGQQQLFDIEHQLHDTSDNVTLERGRRQSGDQSKDMQQFTNATSSYTRQERQSAELSSLTSAAAHPHQSASEQVECSALTSAVQTDLYIQKGDMSRPSSFVTSTQCTRELSSDSVSTQSTPYTAHFTGLTINNNDTFVSNEFEATNQLTSSHISSVIQDTRETCTDGIYTTMKSKPMSMGTQPQVTSQRYVRTSGYNITSGQAGSNTSNTSQTHDNYASYTSHSKLNICPNSSPIYMNLPMKGGGILDEDSSSDDEYLKPSVQTMRDLMSDEPSRHHSRQPSTPQCGHFSVPVPRHMADHPHTQHTSHQHAQNTSHLYTPLTSQHPVQLNLDPVTASNEDSTLRPTARTMQPLPDNCAKQQTIEPVTSGPQQIFSGDLVSRRTESKQPVPMPAPRQRIPVLTLTVSREYRELQHYPSSYSGEVTQPPIPAHTKPHIQSPTSLKPPIELSVLGRSDVTQPLPHSYVKRSPVPPPSRSCNISDARPLPPRPTDTPQSLSTRTLLDQRPLPPTPH